MWKILVKDVDLGEPTSFLDHVYVGLHPKRMSNKQRYCRQLQVHVRIQNLCWSIEKLPSIGKLDADISSWFYDMEGHAKKMCGKILRNKTTQLFYKVAAPCVDDHQFKEEEMKSVGELSQVCSQIVLKCLFLARIGRPDSLWSVNKLARAVTKWTKACEKRLARLISYIHHICEFRQYCYVGKHSTTMHIGIASGF